MSYERQRKGAVKREDYWGTIYRDRQITHSPVFQTQVELAAWVRANRRDGDTVTANRREITGAGFRDVSLTRDDDPPADPERLKTILAGARDKLLEQRSSVMAKPRPQRMTREDYTGPVYGPPEPEKDTATVES